MRARVLVVFAVVCAATGCSRVTQMMKSTPERIERPASDYPGQFHLADGTLNSNAVCQPSLVDPRDKSTISLVRQKIGQGDYKVADGKYGVGPNELLRVDCTIGRAVGVVLAE
jgi:hypothetical protein